MCKRYAISLFIGLLATLAVASCRPLMAAGIAQDSGFVPPTAVMLFDDFDSSAPLPANWQIF